MRDATLSAAALTAVRPTRAGPVPRGDSPGPRAGVPGRSRPGKRPGARRLPARLSLIVGSAGFCAIMIGIVINATMFQKGHHPAPLFASAAPVRPAVIEPPPAIPPLAVVPAVPGPTAPVLAERRPTPPATVATKAPAGPVASSKGAAARHADAIAHLLGTLGNREPVKTAKTGAPHVKAAQAKPAAPVVN